MGRLVVGVNDLATKRPDLVPELVDPSVATSVTWRSNTPVEWRCQNGHVWTALVANRTAKKGTNCPYCFGRYPIVGETDLATTRPDLAAELLDPALATALTTSSNKKIKWRCQLGHEWTASPNSRSSGSACPVCAGRVVLPGFNDMATTRPLLITQLVDPALATTLTGHSNKKVEWRCELGHTWLAAVADKDDEGGCPYCANQRVLAGFNDLASTRPDLAAELADSTLGALVTQGSSTKVRWRCQQGHEWTAAVSDRAGVRATGCPYCSGRRAIPGQTDIATTHPHLIEQLVDQTLATQVSQASDRRVDWRCGLGHMWTSPVKERAQRERGCPYCSNKRVLPGFNDLRTRLPDLAAELVDRSQATTVTPGSEKKFEWQCIQGHTWTASVLNRVVGGTGCPSCAEYGFKRHEPAWMYLLHHPEWAMLQIGVTNDRDTRIETHMRSGWLLVDIDGPLNGGFMLDLEQELLAHLKSAGIPRTPSSSRLRPDKATARPNRRGEAWWIEDLPVASLGELFDFAWNKST